jgi:hypothetical protein
MAKLLGWLWEASLTPRYHAQLIICNILKGKELYKRAEGAWPQDNYIKFIRRKRKHIYSRLNSTSAKELSSAIINPIVDHPRSKTSQNKFVTTKCS